MKIIGTRDFVPGAIARTASDGGKIWIVEVNEKELALFREVSEEGGIDEMRRWARSLLEDLGRRLGFEIVEKRETEASQ